MSDATIVEIGNGVANLPVEKLEEVAKMFCEICDAKTAHHACMSRLHARDGLLVATNGRVLIKIADPRVKAIDKSKKDFLEFTLDHEPTEVVAEGDYVTGELYNLLVAAKAPLIEKNKRERDEFLRDCRRKKATCPCCGEELYIDEYSCRLYEYDEFLDNNMPTESDSTVMLIAPGTPYKTLFSMARFFICVKAARMLGGYCRILLNDKYAQFRGANYYIDIIYCRSDGNKADMVITLPAKGGVE